jgi:hypothetical protein
MEVRETQCDRQGCEAKNASHFFIFSHRAADSAGQMENFYFAFDLCHLCMKDMLDRLFVRLTPESGKEFLKTNKITWLEQ